MSFFKFYVFYKIAFISFSSLVEYKLNCIYQDHAFKLFSLERLRLFCLILSIWKFKFLKVYIYKIYVADCVYS